MGLSRGTKLGSCEILDLIGSGGMGEVYRGRDTKLGRDVAVKSLPDAFAHDADRMARFEREAQILAALNHPNLAIIHDLKEVDGSNYLILELVEGETLAERISRGPVPIDEALDIARQIAEALEAAHEKGIVHRDLKPANVKITPEGKVKVLDFGLAKIHESANSPQHFSNSPTLSAMQTATGVIMGTAAYMSPEQARGKVVDRRGDVWAFGCVLFEMLTGRQTFPNGETVSDTLAGILKGEPNWQALPAATPAKIRALLQRCLRKDARRRLHDMSDARIEVEDSISEPAAPEIPSAVAPQSPSRRRDWAWAGFAGLLLLTTVALAVRPLLQPRQETPQVRFEVFPPENASFSTIQTIIAAVAAPFPSLSPDGRKLAFVATSGSSQLIWVRSLDSSTAQPLAGTEGATQLFWSPDSAQIGFFSLDKVKRVSATGGPPLVLSSNPSTGTANRGGSWGEGGVILLGRDNGPIVRVSADGGQPVPVTELDSSRKELWHGMPSFLPDGRHYLYLAFSQDVENTTSYIGTLDSKERRPLAGIASQVVYSPTGHVLFVRDGTLMAQRFDVDGLALSGEALSIAGEVRFATNVGAGAFSVSMNGSLAYRTGLVGNPSSQNQLAWFDRTGMQLAVVGPKAEYGSSELSPDGKYVAFHRGVPSDIWVMDIQKGLTSRFTSHAANDGQAAWSPDSQSIAFSSQRDNPPNLYERVFGVVGDEKLLLKTDAAKGVPDWSGDGRYLAFISANDIWTIPLSGDRKPLRVTENPFVELNPRISPDGRWIAYASNESGQNEIYIQSFPQSGIKQPVSTGGGNTPRWSQDGRELFYVASDFTLMTVSVKTGSPLEVAAPAPLFQTRMVAGRAYDVSADGRFLMSVPDAEDSPTPITVILNWAEGIGGQ